MISSIYITDAANRFDLELKFVRHFLLHPHTKEVRDAFIATEMKERTQNMNRVLAQEPDHGVADDLIAKAALHNQRRWLENNLHHLREFSENRLNQMELILRYCLFEGFLQKIVGNILWEYPDRAKRQIHAEMKKKNILRLKPPDAANAQSERIAWTKAAVDAVDRLPFANWKGKSQRKGTIFLWQYLRDAFDLNFPQKELWPKLERLHQIRNHIVHRSLELILPNDAIRDAQIYFSNFPTILAETAAKSFPKACTVEKPEPDDDGTPGYEFSEDFY